MFTGKLFANRHHHALLIIRLLDGWLGRLSWPDKDRHAIQLSLEEAAVNGLHHGNQDDPTKKIKIEYEISAAEAAFVVTDEGPGFDPTLVPDPTAPDNLENPNGRGLLLMKHYMTTVCFNNCGNAVTLVKHRSLKSVPVPT